MEQVTITLPLPDRKLSPNSRCHWAQKARAVKYSRDLAFVMARKAGVQGLNWTKASVVATFFWKTRASHDADNAISSLKSVIDGITTAGLLVNDSGLEIGRTLMDYDKKNPRVVLEFTKTE